MSVQKRTGSITVRCRARPVCGASSGGHLTTQQLPCTRGLQLRQGLGKTPDASTPEAEGSFFAPTVPSSSRTIGASLGRRLAGRRPAIRLPKQPLEYRPRVISRRVPNGRTNVVTTPFHRRETDHPMLPLRTPRTRGARTGNRRASRAGTCALATA